MKQITFLVFLLIPAAILTTFVYPASLLVLTAAYLIYNYLDDRKAQFELMNKVKDKIELENAWIKRFQELEDELKKIQLANSLTRKSAHNG